MKKHISRTKNEGCLDDVGGFGGCFGLNVAGMEEPVLVSGTDGCGTKVKMAILTDKHDTIGIDAVAMCVNDIICCGAKPLFFLDYIACGKNYPEKIAALKAEGAKLILVYGIGRMCHIAFWEPTFAADYESAAAWEAAPYRVGAKIHPLTVEQNALTSFKSRTTLVPCRANTIGPGLFLQADYAIGGADGTLGRGMQWQGMSLWMTLRYGKTPWITSSYIPTLAGRLFFLKELAGPLVAECN